MVGIGPSNQYHEVNQQHNEFEWLSELNNADVPMEDVEAPIIRTDFTIFSPLITEIQKYVDIIRKSHEKAKYNRSVCSVLLRRVDSAAGEVKALRRLKNEYTWFFENSKNYLIFQGFVKVIEKIQNFVNNVSQLQGVMKYFNEYRTPEFSMDRKFDSLIVEFEKSTEELIIALQNRFVFVKPKGQNVEDNEAINLDMRDIQKYIETIAATSYEPSDRPTLRDIFTKLFDLSKKNLPTIQRQSVNLPIPTPILSSVQIVQDAITIHKSRNGDRKSAYQIFCKYADLGDSTAKYWVGYYLYYNCLNELRTSEQQRVAIIRAARFFKETADMDLPEAQLRYGHCLWKREGVEKDVIEAVAYFEKSADNGNSTAIYNVGNMYYNGIQNIEKGAYYLRLAALKGQPKAIDMCKRCRISL
ncbi:10123_t:CDS:2 [Ambispora leptoticha]|uniref:10123_t:CDS:1 n=1 Tax=Ambispora leptoticha TaxID=144679 RepID=A0A9N9CRB6_9GLOM|nr:10123_t:CDS:2 [Ambispora leptoticha]